MGLRSEIRAIRREARGKIDELNDRIASVEKRRERAIRAVRRRLDADSLTKRGIRLIADFEGFRSRAYQDVAGVWTIGFGHTGSEAYPGNVITLERAYDLLATDCEIAVRAVRRHVVDDVPLNRNQFDALVSFVFNVGVNAFRTSTLLKELNVNCRSCVPKQLRRWVYAGGVIVPGLVNRREAEIALWQREV